MKGKEKVGGVRKGRERNERKGKKKKKKKIKQRPGSSFWKFWTMRKQNKTAKYERREGTARAESDEKRAKSSHCHPVGGNSFFGKLTVGLLGSVGIYY